MRALTIIHWLMLLQNNGRLVKAKPRAMQRMNSKTDDERLTVKYKQHPLIDLIRDLIF